MPPSRPTRRPAGRRPRIPISSPISVRRRRNRGELKLALSLFRKAREIQPDHWQSLVNEVLVEAFDRKDAAAAQRAYDELKKRHPDIPQIERIQEQISKVRAGA